MSEQDTFERVRSVLSRHIGCAPEEITKTSRLIQDLGADSLDLVEIPFELDKEFGMDISDDAMEGVVTVGDLVDVVKGAQ